MDRRSALVGGLAGVEQHRFRSLGGPAGLNDAPVNTPPDYGATGVQYQSR